MDKNTIITGITVKAQMEAAVNILNREIHPILPQENSSLQQPTLTNKRRKHSKFTDSFRVRTDKKTGKYQLCLI